MSELRAAAELIVGSIVKTVGENTTGYEVVSPPAQWGLAEPYEVAAAYLSEHPTDDSEPLTGEWLLNVGIGYCLSDHAGGFLVNIHYGNGWMTSLALSGKTRGDVRRLCAALGITLKEGER